MLRSPASVVAICSSTQKKYYAIIRHINISTTHFTHSISTTSGAVSGTLKGIISLSNVSPQHCGAIRVGYPIQVEAKSST